MASPAISSLGIQYSIIVPLFNESENIVDLLNEIRAVMGRMGVEWEVILIDDGSSDGTAELLRDKCSRFEDCRVFVFENNHGQASALYFGISKALAPILIILDGDGQNDPGDIPDLLSVLKEGNADMIMGVRKNRRDSILRKTMSRTANAVRSRLLHDGVTDTGCAIKVFKREVADSFIPLRTLYSFMPALAVSAGFHVMEREVNHRPRLKGKSNYGLGVMFWRPIVDMLGVWWFIRRRCATERLLSSIQSSSQKSN